MKLTVRRRKNRNDVPCVAPFIDEMNVWDIPEKEWTDAVKHAVKHAYVLGYKAAKLDIRDALNRAFPDEYGAEWDSNG